ncbi:MAG: hypothetical protein ACTSWY_13450 [Promethearchaeota archaeon]
MILNMFKNTWKKILEFNNNYDRNRESYSIEQIKSLDNIELFFSTLKINPYILNRFISIFSFIINGDNANLVNIIHDPDDRKILSFTLIKSDEDGNYLEFIDKSPSGLELEYEQLSDMEILFDTIKSQVLKDQYVDIGIIKLINHNFLDSIKKLVDIDYIEENMDYFEIIINLFSLLFQGIKHNYIAVFPEPPLITFIKGVIRIFPKIGNLKDLIRYLLPNENISLTFHGLDWYTSIIINSTKKNAKDTENQKNPFNLEVRPAYEFGSVDITDLYAWNKLLNKIQRKYSMDFGTKVNYIVDLKWLADFLFDIFESGIPLDEKRFKYIIQKFLFGVKNIENIWDVSPKPLIFNETIRYILRIFGLHINPRKLSYWALPDLLFLALKKIFGIKYKILLLVGSEKAENSLNSEETQIKEPKQNNFEIKSELIDSKGILISVENSKLTEIHDIGKEEINGILEIVTENIEGMNIEGIRKETGIIYPKKKKEKGKKLSKRLLAEYNFRSNLAMMHKKFGEEFGFISGVFFINRNYLRKIIKIYTIEINSKNPFKNLQALTILNRLKDFKSFCVYPELPFYQIIRKWGIFRLIKQINQIIFDFNEF